MLKNSSLLLRSFEGMKSSRSSQISILSKIFKANFDEEFQSICFQKISWFQIDFVYLILFDSFVFFPNKFDNFLDVLKFYNQIEVKK
jgi:hypothetical protein